MSELIDWKRNELPRVKRAEYERGRKDAAREAVKWLHEEAGRMNDPRARNILNDVAHSLGVHFAEQRREQET